MTVITDLGAWHMNPETPIPGTEPEAVQPTIGRTDAGHIAKMAHLLARAAGLLRESHTDTSGRQWGARARAWLRDYDAMRGKETSDE
jgi:hypothetical protein